MVVKEAAVSASTAPRGAGTANRPADTQRNAYDPLSLQVNLAMRTVPTTGY